MKAEHEFPDRDAYKQYLRDYYAGRAMSQLIDQEGTASGIAIDAVKIADYLIYELGQSGKGEPHIYGETPSPEKPDGCPECGHAKHGKECVKDVFGSFQCDCTHESKAKRIRIVKCSGAYWYPNHIGDEYEVLDTDATVHWTVGPLRSVLIEDAEVIEYV